MRKADSVCWIGKHTNVYVCAHTTHNAKHLHTPTIDTSQPSSFLPHSLTLTHTDESALLSLMTTQNFLSLQQIVFQSFPFQRHLRGKAHDTQIKQGTF